MSKTDVIEIEGVVDVQSRTGERPHCAGTY